MLLGEHDKHQFKGRRNRRGGGAQPPPSKILLHMLTLFQFRGGADCAHYNCICLPPGSVDLPMALNSRCSQLCLFLNCCNVMLRTIAHCVESKVASFSICYCDIIEKFLHCVVKTINLWPVYRLYFVYYCNLAVQKLLLTFWASDLCFNL